MRVQLQTHVQVFEPQIIAIFSSHDTESGNVIKYLLLDHIFCIVERAYYLPTEFYSPDIDGINACRSAGVRTIHRLMCISTSSTFDFKMHIFGASARTTCRSGSVQSLRPVILDSPHQNAQTHVVVFVVVDPDPLQRFLLCVRNVRARQCAHTKRKP